MNLFTYNFSNLNYEMVYDLALMSRNVYYNLNDKRWINVTLPNVFDISTDNDTVKAYLFTNVVGNVNVISFKGTSLSWIRQDFETIDKNKSDFLVNMTSISQNDKYNDNLYFSCCFYKSSNMFKKCDSCKENTTVLNSCCKSCYKKSVKLDLNYMKIADNIIQNIKKHIDFDNSLVIFTGHSLGGTLASMLGLMYNKLTVAFQSPGDKHYIDLIGLGNKNTDNIYHFGHDADPLFVGNCGRTCSSLGYHVDTKCHIGNTCLFKAKEKLGLTESILNHRIDYILKSVIPNWENDFPECIKNKECVDCPNWNYI